MLSIFQTYYDLIKLFKKQNFKSEFTSFLSFLSPIIILGISLLFLFFIPIINNSFDINIIILFHILGLSSIFLIFYAIDNATYFGGLGAAREMFVLAIIEPVTILFIIGFIILSGGHIDLISIQESIKNNNNLLSDFFLLVLALNLFFIMLGENKRFPFDNPSTHLELTMIHEAMLLETNGSKLAIMEIASKLNLIAFINLFIFLIWNNSYGLESNIYITLILYIIKVLIILSIIGFFEVFVTKMRLFKYQNIFGFLLILELITISFYLLK